MNMRLHDYLWQFMEYPNFEKKIAYKYISEYLNTAIFEILKLCCNSDVSF